MCVPFPQRHSQECFWNMAFCTHAKLHIQFSTILFTVFSSFVLFSFVLSCTNAPCVFFFICFFTYAFMTYNFFFVIHKTMNAYCMHVTDNQRKKNLNPLNTDFIPMQHICYCHTCTRFIVVIIIIASPCTYIEFSIFCIVLSLLPSWEWVFFVRFFFVTHAYTTKRPEKCVKLHHLHTI